jgi:hypothetical protein
MGLAAEMVSAEIYWQSHRDWQRENRCHEFWLGMKQFPEVMQYLKALDLWGGDCNNDLAGHLEIVGTYQDALRMKIEGDTIVWESEVWHHADFDSIGAYFRTVYGAELEWWSDEYIDLADVR